MPPLGFIPKSQRTQAQHDAHDEAIQHAVKYALAPIQLGKGESVRLFDFWGKTEVIADLGFKFDRIHQITGSCVWAGGTNALFSTIAAQRLASENPIQAFLPFTLHNYAMSRHYMGDDSRGEGSMGSTFAKSLTLDGVRDWPKSGAPGIPAYTDTDGISVTKADELAWSSYHNPALLGVLSVAKNRILGSAGECKSVNDIRAMLTNGYGTAFACNNNVGHAEIEGSGEDACLIGFWDTPGGHQQSIHAYWEHPQFGPLYWAQNNWPGATYPHDPAGGPICGCWIREAEVIEAMRLDAEVYGYSHQPWFEAQPKVLDWASV